ncbi:hypothetical protein UFOVP184_44 [uncultured Caudovirales phage]|uniref:Uncharacterized protein n=1 Tax=uncultured Caudovirales phage TaxID=2100421 RepID=A0A6J7WCN4_9CAUD|nr:hypothetical protein UFOVP184_44 [uncultured Caudovirales phage]
MRLEIEELINPDYGWIVPVAQIATDQVVKSTPIDPSIPQTMYAMAAIIYAIAAYRRSLRDPK